MEDRQSTLVRVCKGHFGKLGIFEKIIFRTPKRPVLLRSVTRQFWYLKALRLQSHKHISTSTILSTHNDLRQWRTLLVKVNSSKHFVLSCARRSKHWHPLQVHDLSVEWRGAIGRVYSLWSIQRNTTATSGVI